MHGGRKSIPGEDCTERGGEALGTGRGSDWTCGEHQGQTPPRLWRVCPMSTPDHLSSRGVRGHADAASAPVGDRGAEFPASLRGAGRRPLLPGEPQPGPAHLSARGQCQADQACSLPGARPKRTQRLSAETWGLLRLPLERVSGAQGGRLGTPGPEGQPPTIRSGARAVGSGGWCSAR